MNIQPILYSTLEADPAWPELTALYAQESGNSDMGATGAAGAIYRQLEQVGALRVLAAMQDGAVIGHCGVLLTPSPHYGGQLVASIEAIFVLPAHRKSGAGLVLLRAAEDVGRDAGAVAMLASSPIGGRLADVLPRKGYKAANIFFTKRLDHAARD